MNMKTNILFTTMGKLASLFVLSLIVGSCTPDNFQKLDERNWELVWSDEFNGNAGVLPDPTKWSFDIGTGQDGWGNQELQFYTNRPENVSLDGQGNLVITARAESFSGRQFTSARIKTQGLFQQAYGRFEARIKNPYGPGLWPAFWMLGSNIETVGWPQAGEIDIMEMRGQDPTVISGSLHGPGYSGGNPVSGSYALKNGRYDADFYVYAVEWFPDRIDFFVDDYLYNRIRPRDVKGEWVFDHPFFMIINLAVGGSYVGFPNPNTPFPQKMVIDYVRVYK
jgi:beta-glucanase (GH16 family)